MDGLFGGYCAVSFIVFASLMILIGLEPAEDNSKLNTEVLTAVIVSALWIVAVPGIFAGWLLRATLLKKQNQRRP